MGTFSKIKKYSKPSLEIIQLEKDLKKTGMGVDRSLRSCYDK
jgi:hypothetical protein